VIIERKLTCGVFAIVVAENEETAKDDDEIGNRYENRSHGKQAEDNKSCSVTWSSLDVLAGWTCNVAINDVCGRAMHRGC
jgi:hypothetical protein